MTMEGTSLRIINSIENKLLLVYIERFIAWQGAEDVPRYLVSGGGTDQSRRVLSASHCPYLFTYCAPSIRALQIFSLSRSTLEYLGT